MTKEVKEKKRKSSVPEGDAEKVKKVKKAVSEAVEASEAPLKKRKATEDAATSKTKKSKTPKPGVDVDTSATNGTNETTSAVLPKKSKKPSKDSELELNGASESKNIKAKKIAAEAPKPSQELAVDAASSDVEEGIDDDDAESEVDDQTEALLKGFESSGDEADAQKEGGMKPGQAVPKVPTMNNKSRKQLKRLAEKAEAEQPGVVYIGHIPHGFYEEEMRAYFTQFGAILKLRLSRNRKTGASKHYAWIQFESATVAEIVARTMDNYLLFNHILKVKVVPDEQVPDNLFKGANKRFKKVPWNKIEGRKLEQPASEETWEKRIAKEELRREGKAEKLKEMGYEFEAPAIKSAKGVSKKKVMANGATPKAIEDAPKAIEDAPVSKQPSQPAQKKAKKPKKNEIYGIDVEEATRLMLEKEKRDAAEKARAEAARENEELAKAAQDSTVNLGESAPTEKAEKPKGKGSKQDKNAKPTKVRESALLAAESEESKGEKDVQSKPTEVLGIAGPAADVEQPNGSKAKKSKKDKKAKPAEVLESSAPAVEDEVPEEPKAKMSKESKEPKEKKAKKSKLQTEIESMNEILESEMPKPKKEKNKKRKAEDADADANVDANANVAEAPAEKKEKKEKKVKKTTPIA